jgi:large subunit ribosomal protein L21
MKAIIQVGSRQYNVSEGDKFDVPHLKNPVGDALDLVKVLAIIDGEKTTIGTPYVAGATVTIKVLGHGKEKKVLVFRYKPKKRVRTLTGHRQQFTTIKIERIVAA